MKVSQPLADIILLIALIFTQQFFFFSINTEKPYLLIIFVIVKTSELDTKAVASFCLRNCFWTIVYSSHQAWTGAHLRYTGTLSLMFLFIKEAQQI